MHPDAPHSYPRRILLAVTGLSPQILTETLYALAVANEPAFVPTEVHLITTSEGAERARLALLSDQPGWFHRLRKDYALPGIAFDDSHIHVVRDHAGQPLADIRSPADNLVCADFITEKLRELSADPNAALHVSIAGGRKTMGYFIGYALSLFGRPQDRLSHVLAAEPFESSWSFFYPTPYENIIETRDKKLMDTSKAAISLTEIPFVSLRHGLPTALLDGSARFESTVAAARASLGSPTLEIDLGSREVRAAGRSFRMTPANLAMLAMFARMALEGARPQPAPDKESPDATWGQRYLAELQSIVGVMGGTDPNMRALKNGMDGNYFWQRLSKLHSALRKALGPAARHYQIDDGGKKPHLYRLALAPEAVRLRDSRRGSTAR